MPDEDEIAEVEVVRSGGFAGIRRTKRTAGGDLDAAQRAALGALHGAAGGRGRPGRASAAAAPPRGADRFAYGVTIRRKDGTERRVDLPEGAVPPALRGLLP